MIVKALIDEDFCNYKKPSMFIGFPSCTWKCEKECGKQVCQNGTLATCPNIYIDTSNVIERYLENTITNAIVLGGLEPFDTFEQLIEFVTLFREKSLDDIVIYTGYYKEEIEKEIDELREFPNIVIKYGRFIPNQQKHYDEVLGVSLASDNQYAEILTNKE